MKGIKRFSIVLTVVLYALIAVNLPIFADDPEAKEVVAVIGGDLSSTATIDNDDEKHSNDISDSIEIVVDNVDIEKTEEDFEETGEDGVDYVVIEETVITKDDPDTEVDETKTSKSENTGSGEILNLGLVDVDYETGTVNPADLTVSVAPELGKEVVDVDVMIEGLITHGFITEEYEDAIAADEITEGELPSGRIVRPTEITIDGKTYGTGAYEIVTPTEHYVLVKVVGDITGTEYWRLYDASTDEYKEIDITVVTQDLNLEEGILDEKTGALNLKYDEYQILVDDSTLLGFPEDDSVRVTIFNGKEGEIDKYIKGWESYEPGEGLAIENIIGVVKDENGNIINDGIIVNYDPESGDVTIMAKDGKLTDGKYTVYLDGYYTEKVYGENQTARYGSLGEYIREGVETLFVNPDVDYGYKVNEDGSLVVDEEGNPIPDETRTTYTRKGILTIDKETSVIESHSAWARVAAIDVYVKHVDIPDSILGLDITDDYIVFKGKKGDVEDNTKTYEVEYNESILGYDWTRTFTLTDAEMSIVVTDVEEKDGYHPVFTVTDSRGNEIEATAKFENGVWVLEFANNQFAGTYTVSWEYEENPTPAPTPKKASGYTFVATGI